MLDPAAARNQFADDLVAEYQRLELILLELIADKLSRGLDAPDWAQRQVMELQRFRKEAGVIAAKMAGKSPELIAAAIQQAVTDGFMAASQDIATAEGIPTGRVIANAGSVPAVDGLAIASLLAETTGALDTVNRGVLRATDDIYRRVVARASTVVVAGAETRIQATQRALNEFTRQGISGFRDARGRSWSLTAYTEMAIRTGTTSALMQSHSDRLTERGYDLVIVSSHPRPAPQCQPYERQILSLSGRTVGVIDETSRTTGRTIKVKVKASLAEAEARGLHHPNCRHRHSLFVPGVTDISPTKADDEGYEDTQKLRYLERGAREWKRRAATALDPAEKKAAQAKAREWQARIKDHTEATGVGRRRDRERIDLGLKTGQLDTAKVATPKKPQAKPKAPTKPAPVAIDVEYGPKLSPLNRSVIDRQIDAVPEAARASFARSGTKLIIARNTSETSVGNAYKNRVSADGRSLEGTSFYDHDVNRIHINANHMGGSVNVIAHELAHSLDFNHLKTRPARVEVQDPGSPAYTYTVQELAYDPYLVWAHQLVRDSPTGNVYFKTGSGDNPLSGRREWIAESYAAIVEGRDDILASVSGGSVEAADLIRWTFNRHGVL